MWYRSVLILTCMLVAGVEAQDIFDKSHSAQYVKYLYSQERYEDALVEFERLRVMGWTSDSTYRLGLVSATLLHKYPTADVYFSELGYRHGIDELSRFCYLNRPEFGSFDLDYIRTNAMYQMLSDSMQSRLLVNYLVGHDRYKEAANFLLDSKSLGKKYKKELIPIVQKGYFMKKKSLVLAGIFSAMIPGTGKMYTGEWRDGAFALVSLGVLSYATYRLYSNQGLDSPWFYLTAGVSLLFYAGNVYGSIQSALKINRKRSAQLRHEAQQVIYSY